MVYVLTVKEACNALKIGKTKLYGMLGRGEIEAFRLGRKVLFKSEVIEHFIATAPKVQTPTYHRLSSKKAA